MILKSAVIRFVPMQMRPIIHSLRAAFSGVHHVYQSLRLFGANASLVPPLDRMHDGPVGYDIFKENGDEFLRYYVQLCSLRPDEKILDVGSGIGRKTIPLTKYLNQQGRYEGIEIVKSGVDWCKDRITRRYPNFQFQLIDVFNTYYNPAGSIKASEYRFPFSEESFDLVVLASVFTHMLPHDISNYLQEVRRVLKNGGRCLISFFLLNLESLELLASGQSTLDLKQAGKAHYLVDPEVPEQTVGYDERFVLSLYSRCGLEIRQPVHYGSWCGRRQYLSYQDLIVAQR